MSFSSQTKEEVARLKESKECCSLAELAALIRMDGSLQIAAYQHYTLNVITESAPVARRIFRLAKQVLNRPVTVVVRRKMRLKKNNSYVVKIACLTEDLQKLGLLSPEGGLQQGIAPALIKRRCDRKAYIRGAFLTGGSISNPENSYHLEIITKDETLAHDLAKLMNGFDLKARVSTRKNVWVVYLKDSDMLSDFLALIQAHQAVLQFENIRVMKEVRNTVNRQVNCETANLSKIVDAAVRQQENIRLIERTIGVKALPDNLREIACLRMAYPEATLKELGQKLAPSVGKSGVSHRLRRIDEIAEKISQEKGKQPTKNLGVKP